MPGGRGTAVFGAFVAASTSPLIEMANQNAVRRAIVVVDNTGPVDDLVGTLFDNGGMGAGPNLGGMTLVTGSTSGAGRGGSSEQVGVGQSISPN